MRIVLLIALLTSGCAAKAQWASPEHSRLQAIESLVKRLDEKITAVQNATQANQQSGGLLNVMIHDGFSNAIVEIGLALLAGTVGIVGARRVRAKDRAAMAMVKAVEREGDSELKGRIAQMATRDGVWPQVHRWAKRMIPRERQPFEQAKNGRT